MPEVFFTTVVRAAPVADGGELVRLDWDTKTVLGRRPLVPVSPGLTHEGGNGRGGRGLARRGDRLWAAVYDAVLEFTPDLEPQGVVSHPLMAGLHEIAPDGDRLWVTSTAIDALLCVGLDGELHDSWWPREIPALQRRWGLEPLAIDKAADNRVRWVADPQQKGPHHVHLNAVALDRGRPHVLLNRLGAVVDTVDARVVVAEERLCGAHNVGFHAGRVLVNDTRRTVLRLFGEAGETEIDLRADARVADLLATAVISETERRRAGFLRGLAALGPDRLLVGLSPASLAEIDLREGRVVDVWTYSTEVAVCVHGLLVWDPSGG